MITKKEQDTIDLVQRFCLLASDLANITEKCWRDWLPTKNKSLTDSQLSIIHRYVENDTLDGDSMFLLHQGYGITLPQIEAHSLKCSSISRYASLLHGLRMMTMTVALWKEDLHFSINGKLRPLITKHELEEASYSVLVRNL